jgi:protease IV
MRFIGKVLKWIGAITVVCVLLLVYAVWSFEEDLPETMILEVDFRKGAVEYVGDHPLASLRGDHLTVREQVAAITRAGLDDRVLGLIGRIGGARMSLAHVQEYADAISVFRASGKPAIAFAESIGGLVPANGSYLLATAFEEIRMQPSGGVGLVGLAVEHPFLKGTLDSLGIEPVFGKREDFKLAPNLFTEDGFTEDHLHATRRLLSDQFSQLVEGVARGRQVDTTTVVAWIDEGPFDAQTAFAKGLIDELSYLDEARKRFRGDGETEFIALKDYTETLDVVSGASVGVIYGVGTITSGASIYDPVGDSQTAGSDTIVEAFEEAIEANVEAIIFRVDSPGGSYVASDAVWRATRLAQERGIPVVVSMGAAAASGGYLVSTHADRIIAQPGTITGSIGVWAGKFLTPKLWQRLGVSWDTVSLGKRASMFSSLKDFSPEERAYFDAELDRVYDAFTAQVGDGRDIDPNPLDAVARGRVWTGKEARENGLVDVLGGFSTSLIVTRELLGLQSDAELDVVVFPKPKELAERLLEGDWEVLTEDYASGFSIDQLSSRVGDLKSLLAGPVAWAPWINVIRY